MGCLHCPTRARDGLLRLEGVLAAKVFLADDLAVAAYDPERIGAFKRELRSRARAVDVYTQAVGIEEKINRLVDPYSGELEVPLGLLKSQGVARQV